MDTGYIYYPLTDGVTHELSVYEVTGHVVQISTGEVITTVPNDVFDYRVDLLTVNPHSNSPQFANFRHNVNFQGFGNLPYFPIYSTDVGKTKLYDNSALWASFGVAWDGNQYMPYIGEIRNQMGGFCIPPEPELPLFPHDGQVLDVHSTVYNSDGSVAVADWRSSLYVLTHSNEWKGWKDVWWTVLTERSGTDIYIYEYVFARNVGIIDAWGGRLVNGVFEGYEYVLQNIIKS